MVMRPNRLFLSRVLRRRCPQCGQGALFQSRARLAPECSVCGLKYRREAGAQTGSMYLSAAVTQVFAALIILSFAFLTDWSTMRMIAIGLPLVALFCVLFQPYSMALWVAVEYTTDVANEETWVEPRLPQAGGGAGGGA